MGAANNLRSDKTHSTNPPTTPLDANQTQKQREKSLPCLRGKVACSAGRGDKTSKILSHTKGIDMSNATLPACAPLPLGAKNPQ